MANTAAAIAWILAQSDTFNLEVHELTWLQDVLPGWTDVVCSLTIEDRKIYGWGAAETSDLALIKAFAEALERHALHGLKAKTSSGMAAHIKREEAQKAAVRELIERDSFLCHFLTKTPFRAIAGAYRKAWGWSDQMQAWATRHCLQVGLFHLGTSGIVCTIDGRRAQTPFGYIIGAANKDDVEASAVGAFIEAARRAARCLEKQNLFRSLPLNDFLAIKNPDFADHGRLAQDLMYADQIAFLFPETTDTDSGFGNQYSEVDRQAIFVLDVAFPLDALGNNPFVFAQASSPVAQSMFLGPTSEKYVNLKRLREFTGRQIHFADLNPLPHPFD